MHCDPVCPPLRQKVQLCAGRKALTELRNGPIDQHAFAAVERKQEQGEGAEKVVG